MLDQQKILRVFKLIKLLAEKPHYTVKELASKIEISSKPVYKYLELLEELGYNIDSDRHNRYFLHDQINEKKASFSYEEMNILQNLIDTIPNEQPLKQSLRGKLNTQADILPNAQEIIDKGLAKIINQLHEAIEQKKRVKLIDYHSSNSDNIKNRLVEPIALIKSQSNLEAFDLEKNEIRHFKIKRITKVEVLNDPSLHNHVSFPTDIFGFTGPKELQIKVVLNQVAYKILMEEFPDARYYTKKWKENEEKYLLEYGVRHYTGIGRFVLGMMSDVLVIGSEEFKQFLKEKINKASILANEENE